MAARHSYIFLILEYLRERRIPGSMEDIFDSLLQAKSTLRFTEGLTLQVPNDLGALQEVLSRLTEIGVLRAHEGGGGRKSWSLATEVATGERENNPAAEGVGGESGGGGGRGGGRGGPGGDGPEGQGGGGLSEVLAHPVLFCMAEEDQDELLLAALGLAPDGANANDGAAL